MRVDLQNGKYTVIQEPSGRLHCLRYGEPWRDCTGDGLIYSLAAEVEALRERIKAASNFLVCVAIADWQEVVNNTLKILEDRA